MRKVFALIFAAAAILGAHCAEPQIQWLETDHNFGAFDEDDGNVTCEFRFVNVGSEPVKVLSVRTSCGCTTSQPPRGAIQPGDTASVSATYNPVGRPGRFEKKVYVDMNTVPARHNLTIHGTVIGASNTLRSRYPVDAGKLKFRTAVVPFGLVNKGKLKSEFFEIYNASSDTIYPRWENLPPYVRATSASDFVAPGEQLSYAMMFDALRDVPYGIVTDSVAVSDGYGSYHVSIVAQVAEDFSHMTPKQLVEAPAVRVEPTVVDFGEFSATATAIRTVKISNMGKNTLIVRRVYSGDPGVNVSVDKTKIKPGKEALITIAVEPSQLPTDVLNARVSLITNDPSNPTETIRLSGFRN